MVCLLQGEEPVRRVIKAIFVRYEKVRSSLVILLLLVAQLSFTQGTWYGEIGLSGGGGANDIFRFSKLVGDAAYKGEGMWSAGVDIRRLFGDHFSLETGAFYSHQYYVVTPAAGIAGEDIHDNLGLITIPLTARVDFLKWFFADAGINASLQAGSSHADDMSGLGATLGTGFQYNFRSDFFVRVKAFATQYALLHFKPEDYPQTLWNSGITVGFGYQFIHLGRCNCPHDNAQPGRRFF
jgi:hypothetical protein